MTQLFSSDTRSRLIVGNSMITKDGSFCVRMTNKSGAPSVKGTIVEASGTTDHAFTTITADDPDPIGVVYEDGIADGSECWIAVYGKVQILLQDSTAATRGYWVRASSSVAGRGDATNAAPPGGGVAEIDTHLKEIGHCIESVTAGTNKLCWIILHFN